MSPENEVLAAQSQLMTAIFAGDRDACDRLLADDCSFIRMNGHSTADVVLRDGWLEEIAKGAAEKAEVTDSVISMHGDVAVATVYWRQGDDGACRAVTDIWKRTSQGRWSLTERHSL